MCISAGCFFKDQKKEAGTEKKKKEVESGAVDNRTGACCILRLEQCG
jgi:hypothetical protein